MTAGWTAGCRCVSLTRHTPAATSEASCFDACARRSTCCQMPWDAMGCHGMPWDAMGCHGMPWWNAMGNPEIKKHGAPTYRTFRIHAAAHCSMAQWSLQESFNGLESKHAKHGIFVQPASCFKMVLGYPSVSNKTTVSTYYPEKKAAELEETGLGKLKLSVSY